MSFMTKLEGVPDSDAAKPGMAFFAGTGPYGATCGDCKLRGYQRQSMKGVWNEKLQQEVFRNYRVTSCQQYRRLTGHHGAPVDKDYPACKYFEAVEKKSPDGRGTDNARQD